MPGPPGASPVGPLQISSSAAQHRRTVAWPDGSSFKQSVSPTWAVVARGIAVAAIIAVASPLVLRVYRNVYSGTAAGQSSYNSPPRVQPYEDPRSAPGSLRNPAGTTTRPFTAILPPSLWCFALMLPWGYETELLSDQLSRRIGIFACDDYTVFSNTTMRLTGKGTSSSVWTHPIGGSLVVGLGGKYNTAMNTGVFIRVWKSVFLLGHFQEHSWTVKVDPDTVFVASRLRRMLAFEPETNVYVNNCKFGLHGPIEVLSRGAVDAYMRNQSACDGIKKAAMDLRKPFKDVDHAFGEDLFLSRCLERGLGIRPVDEFKLLLEETACGRWSRPVICSGEHISFHPFKDVKSYVECWKNATSEESSRKWTKALAIVHPLSSLSLHSTIPGVISTSSAPEGISPVVGDLAGRESPLNSRVVEGSNDPGFSQPAPRMPTAAENRQPLVEKTTQPSAETQLQAGPGAMVFPPPSNPVPVMPTPTTDTSETQPSSAETLGQPAQSTQPIPAVPVTPAYDSGLQQAQAEEAEVVEEEKLELDAEKAQREEAAEVAQEEAAEAAKIKQESVDKEEENKLEIKATPTPSEIAKVQMEEAQMVEEERKAAAEEAKALARKKRPPEVDKDLKQIAFDEQPANFPAESRQPTLDVERRSGKSAAEKAVAEEVKAEARMQALQSANELSAAMKQEESAIGPVQGVQSFQAVQLPLGAVRFPKGSTQPQVFGGMPSAPSAPAGGTEGRTEANRAGWTTQWPPQSGQTSDEIQ